MQDRVEGVDRVGRVQVAARVGAGAVEDEGAAPVEEGGELGDDFCFGKRGGKGRLVEVPLMGKGVTRVGVDVLCV